MPVYLTTLLAVLVGGLVTFLTQWWLEGVRAQREGKRDERRAAREQEREQAAFEMDMRVARRLVLEELDSIYLQYGILARGGCFPQEGIPVGSGVFLACDAWDANKRTMARGLTDDQWEALTPFLHTVPGTRAMLLAGQPMSPLPEYLLNDLRQGVEVARHCYVMLAGTRPPTDKYESSR